MSTSKKLLKEVKDEVELEQVNGGDCSWYDVYVDMMNTFVDPTGDGFGSHSHTMCTDSNSGSSGGSDSGGYGCWNY